jgi:hypothetical protein
VSKIAGSKKGFCVCRVRTIDHSKKREILRNVEDESEGNWRRRDQKAQKVEKVREEQRNPIYRV